jgi:hypothetical protein
MLGSMQLAPTPIVSDKLKLAMRNEDFEEGNARDPSRFLQMPMRFARSARPRHNGSKVRDIRG